MKKTLYSLMVSFLCFLSLQSCKNSTKEEKTDTTKIIHNEVYLRKADSLLAQVHKEWKVYTDLDSVKYKDLQGVYFQLKNLSGTNTKKLEAFEKTTKEYESKNMSLYMPNFVNEFFSYDSLLMVHVKEVVTFSEETKGAENLAVLKQLNKSLIDAVDDNLFVSIQSHLDLSIAYYNEYLKAHPELITKDGKHQLLPEFGSIDRSQLKPII